MKISTPRNATDAKGRQVSLLSSFSRCCRGLMPIFILFAFLLTTSAAMAQPANDLCGDAIELSGVGTLTGTTIGSSTFGAPLADPGCWNGLGFSSNGIDGPGVWYSITNAFAGPVHIDLCGTDFSNNFDGQLHVYSGACGTFTCVTENDDNGLGICSDSFDSAVDFVAVGGEDYFIYVDNWVGSTGDFIMNYDVAECADPITFANCPLSQSYDLDLSCTTNPPLVPNLIPFVQANGGVDVGCNTIASVTQDPAAGTSLTAIAGYPFSDGDVVDVTITVTSDNGTVGSCTVEATLNDTGTPQLDCVADQVQEISSDCENAVVPDFRLDALISLGCNDLDEDDIIQDPAPGTLISTLTTVADGGTYTVDVNIEYGLGQSTSCPEFTVTLDITQAFTLSGCPADVTVSNTPGECGGVATWTEPTVTEACGNPVGSKSSHSPGDVFPIGTTQVTYGFADDDGNVNACFFDVTVTDDEAPTNLTCPGGGNNTINRVTNADDCNRNVNYALPTFSDNCAVTAVSLVSGQAPDTDFPVGVTTVTWRAFDAAGNFTDCSFDVVITDQTDPVALNCPTVNPHINFNANCNDANTPPLPDFTALPGFTDNCGVVTLSQSPAAGTSLNTLTGTPFSDGALIAITITAIDDNGNSSTCTFDAELNDNIGPSIFCPGDQTVFSEDFGDGFCGFTLPDFTGEAQASVLCGNNGDVTITQSASTPPPYTNGDVITVTLTAHDGPLGDPGTNTSSCDITVDFCDNTAPTVAADIEGFVGAFAPGAWTTVIGNDPAPNAGSVTIDATTLTIVGNDAGGDNVSNQATATCPLSGSYGFSWNFTTDDLGGFADPFESSFYINGALLPIADSFGGSNQSGTILVNCTVGDVIGFVVTSFDGAFGPATLAITDFTVINDLNCQAPDEVVTEPGDCTASVTLTPPNALDNCYDDLNIFGVRSDGGDTLTLDNLYTGVFPACLTEVTWYAEDGKGNLSEALCIVTVSVKEADNEQNQPTAICQDLDVYLNDTGMAMITGAQLAPASTDACSDLTFLVARSNEDGSPLPGEVFAESVTLTCADTTVFICVQVFDCSGNMAACVSEVTVLDRNDPYIECPGDITIECYVDGDGNPDPGLSPHLPGYPFAANTPVDLAALQAWAAENYGVGNPSPGQDAVAGITGLPLAYDNCVGTVSYSDQHYYYVNGVRTPGSYTSTLPLNDPHECEHHNYEIDRTWTVTDGGGRTAMCVQTITVQDTNLPVIDPLNVVDATIACDDAAALAVLLAQAPSAMDSCYLATFDLIEDNSGAPEAINSPLFGGDCERERITRVWRATDACGNFSELTQTINLIDTVPPSLTVTVDGTTFVGEGPHEIILENDPGLCNHLTSFTATSSDNCSDIIVDAYTFLEDSDPVLPTALLNFTFLNGTTSFDRVVEKDTTTFYIGVLDDCLNLSFVEIDVIVIDTEDPVITCSGDTLTFFTSNDDFPLFQDDETDCAALVRIPVPAFMDNCPQGDNGRILYSLDGGAFVGEVGGTDVVFNPLSVGYHTVVFRSEDDAGNFAECSQTILVVDDQDPVVVCPIQTQIPFLGTLEAATVYVTTSDDGTDDCTATFSNGQYGGVFGALNNIIPEVSDNCFYTATYTLTGAGAADVADNTGTFTYVPASIVAESAPGMDFDLNLGNTSILIYVTDAAGNVAQCSFSVTVYDDVDPTIQCPDDIVATTDTDGDDPDDCTFTADVITSVLPSILDNCGIDRLEYTMAADPVLGGTAASGTIDYADLATSELTAIDFEVGVTTVTYTVFDVQLLNSATCSFTVTVTDTLRPVIACPEFPYLLGTSGNIYSNGLTGETADLDTLLHSGGDCATTVDGLSITTTDNCCVSSVQYQVKNSLGEVVQAWIAESNEPLPADADQILDLSDLEFDKGLWTVELRAWDCHMNEDTCSFTVEVFDDEKPAFASCPADRTRNTVATDCNQTVTWTRPLDSEVMDNCLAECGVDLIQGPFFSTNADLSSTSGIDTGIFADPISNGTEAALFPVGIRYVKYYVDDEHGNREWCIFQVTVIDNIDPTVAVVNGELACSTGEELNFNLDCNDANTPLFPNYTSAATFDDNCSIVSITQSIAAGSLLSNVFPTPFVDGASVSLTLTATDTGGNTVTCTFDVTLNDNIGPSIACPGDQLLGSTAFGNGSCGFILPSFIDQATAQVLCGNELATVTQSPAAGDVFPNAAGTSIVVTLTASDAAGNTVACDFNVGFTDDTAPTLAPGYVCIDPDPVVLAESTAQVDICQALIQLTPPDVVDNCLGDLTIIGKRDDGGAWLTEEDDFYTANFSPCETVVTWYAIDAAGVESEALCSVTVVVTEPDGEFNQPFANCNQNITSGLNDAGIATVCIAQVDNGSFDACSDVTIKIAKADENGPIDGEPELDCLTYDCSDRGIQYICLKVTDCSGNENFCTTTVLIEDKKEPRIVCPADITIECDVDNDGDPLAFEAGNLPPHALNYPAANTPTDISLYNDWLADPALTTQGQDAANGITGLPLAFDNCEATVSYVNNYFYQDANGDYVVAGEYDELPLNDPHECAHHNYNIQRVWTVTDAEGYTAECTQLIQVRDTEAPVIDPEDLVLFATAECSDQAAIDELLAESPSATDNCYLASLELTFDNSGSPLDLGCLEQITRTWTAIDACGNTSTLTQTINLIDTTNPTLTVEAVGGAIDPLDPNGVSFSTDPGLCTALVTFNLLSDDNCDDDLYDDFILFVNGSFVDGVILNGTDNFQLVLDKGTSAVDVYVSDDCGNFANVILQVTVEDDEAPVFEDCTEETFTFFTSQEDTPDNEANGTDCYGSVDIAVPPFQDNCPLTMGNMTGSITMEIILGEGSIPANWTLFPYTQGTAIDVTADAGTVLQGGMPTGTHTIIFTMTDAAGNTAVDDCTYAYSVEDDQDPILDCPSNMLLALSGDGDTDDCDYDFVDGLGGNASIIPIELSDNCGYTFDLTLSGATTAALTDVDVPAGLDFELNVGATSFVYTATDDNGNQTQCSFVVTVEDDIIPAISCPSFPDAIEADASECFATLDLTPVLADNCEGGHLTYVLSGATTLSGELEITGDPTDLDLLGAIDVNVGTTFGNYTYYDEEGNQISCSFTILVIDTQLPVVSCPAAVVFGTSGADYTATAIGSLPYAAGDCETTIPTLTFDATDNCCISSVQYQIVDAESGELLTEWVVLPNMPLPADGDMTLDLTTISFEKGDYTINFRAWDCSMNEGLCSTSVIVVDDEQPLFTDCPDPISVNQSTAACGQNVQWNKPDQNAVLDNCLLECGLNDIQGPFISFDDLESEANIDPLVEVIGDENPFALFPVGTRYVKYYVEDLAGNVTWCVFEVTVIDNIPPVVSACPSNVIQINMDLNCDNTLDLADYTGIPDFTDICGFTLSQAAQLPFVDGGVVVDGQVILVDIIADDGTNTSTCTLTLEVNDSALPNLICASDQVLSASTPGVVTSDCMFALPDFTLAPFSSASPSCASGSVTITQDPAPGVMALPGAPFFVTLTATDDASGNSVSCSFLVAYVDNVGPQLEAGGCGQTDAAATTAAGACTASVSLIPPTAGDCAGVAQVYGISDGGLFLNGNNQYTADFPTCTSVVTWYATDTNGNTDILEGCETTVVVSEPLDEQSQPTAACRADMILELGQDGVVTLFAENYGINSYDNCPGGELDYAIHIWENGAPVAPSADEIEFGCDRVGENVICLIVTDCSGNSAACFGTIVIQDRTDPMIVCPAEITIDCHNDNGGDPDPGSAPAVITPIDLDEIAAYDNTTGQDAATGMTGYAQGFDNCGGVVTYTDESTQSEDVDACDFYTYTITRTFTVTDPYNNDNDLDGNSCTQIINVEDVIDPFFLEGDDEFLLDRVINCEDPNFQAKLDLALALEPTADDLCYVASVELTEETVEQENCIIYNGTANIYEQLIRTWTATDACGNSVTYTQVISLQDTTAPALDCPNGGVPVDYATSLGGGSGECFANVNLLADMDDCQEIDTAYFSVNDLTNANLLVFSGGGLNFVSDSVPPGEYCVHFTVIDPCGNTAECVYFFSVTDDTAPMLDCSALSEITQGNDVGVCEGTVAITHPLFSDNCAGGQLLVDYGLGDGQQEVISDGSIVTFPVGTTTVTYSAQDAEGLPTLGCTFDVTILDDEAPTFENCDPTTIALNTSVDGFSNYDCSAPYSFKSPFVDDNCEVASYTIQIGDAAPAATFGDASYQEDFPVGTTAVVFLVTDAAGNSSSCSFEVIVTDDEEPVTLCQDATIELDETGTALLTADQVDGGSYDNCTLNLAVSQESFDCSELGDNTVTLTTSDDSGNSFSCIATVTVEDNLAPTIDNCLDRTEDAADGTCEYIVVGTDWDAIAADNCSVEITNDYNDAASLDGESFPTGTTTVEWTATDVAGNVTTCTMTVTIGNPDLQAVCRSYINTNTLQLGDDGTLTLTAADFDNGSGSACDDLSLLISDDNGQTFASALTFDCSDITLGTPLNILLLATDDATGDDDQCIAQLSLTDGPVLVEDCPTDVTVDAVVDDCGAQVTLTLPETEGSCPVFEYQINGGGFTSTDADVDAFFEIGTYEVQWAITNASGDDAVVSGTGDNICSFTVTVNANGAIVGCTDNSAENYNDNATCDDGSCVFAAPCVTLDQLPLAEDFEDGLGVWTQEINDDDIDWNLNQGPTPTGAIDGMTGPEGASSGTTYLYVESSFPNFPGKTAKLNSPCMDLLGATSSSAQFAYNMNGEDVGSLELKVTVDGADWTTVWSQEGDQGADWHAVELDLSDYEDEMIKLRFEGETTDNYNGDIAIDLFELQASADPEPDCPGDITGNGTVDIQDFVAFNSAFGSACDDCAEDMNKDGFVDINDFLILNSAFGTDCNETTSALSSGGDMAALVEAHPEIDVNEDLQKILDDMRELSFTLYPNPNEGNGINLFLDQTAAQVTVQVRDVSGRLLTSESLQGSENGLTHYIDFQEKLSSGMYMVVVDTDGVTTTKRFVVE